MHFDFSVPIKKQRNHTQKVKLSLYDTLIKNVYCIATINSDGTYYALDIESGDSFLLTSRSYCVRTTQYYAQQLVNNKRIEVITLTKIKEFNAPWLYLPFAPGVGMLGNIVKSKFSDGLMFDLTKTFKMPKDNELAREAFLFYRENYAEIYQNILNKYGVTESFRNDC